MQKPDGTSSKDNASKTPAPGEYADFTAPEGYTIDKALIESAIPIFKEAGISQEVAQKLVDLQVQRELAAAKAPQQAYTDLRADWVKATLADPDISTGGKLKPDVQPTIAKAIDSLPADLGKAFRETMDTTGVGDNPAFVKAMYKFAQAFTEGGHVSGKGPSPGGQQAPDAKPVSIASAMYPGLK